MLYIDSIWEYIVNFLELALFIIFIHKKLRIRANYKHQAVLMFQTVDKVSHYCAGFFFAKYQNVQCLCGFFGTFLV